MSRSAYAVTRILAPQRQGVFRTGRRQEMASALTDAARSLDEIVRGMDGAAPIEALTIATRLLRVERALMAVSNPDTSGGSGTGSEP